MSRVTFQWTGDVFTQRVRAAVPVALAKAGEQIRQKAQTLLSGSSPSKAGSPPGVDSGHLRRSIYNARAGNKQRVGTEVAYGAYQEFGAVITPKRVKFLPVPLNYSAKRLLKSNNRPGGGSGSLRSRGNLKVIRYRGGRLFLKEVTPTGKIKKNGAAFKLVRRVVLRPRPWLRPAVAQASAAAHAAFAEEMQRATAAATQASIGPRAGAA